MILFDNDYYLHEEQARYKMVLMKCIQCAIAQYPETCS